MCRHHLAPFHRVRRLELRELPKTISGEIRSIEPRQREQELFGSRPEGEWRDDDVDLRSTG